MLNFRKLKSDFSPQILKEGKELYDKELVQSIKIINLSSHSISLNCQVCGNFSNKYECEIEIDRCQSIITESNCDCPYKYDCQHLAAAIFYIENYIDKLIVDFSEKGGL